MSFTDGDRLLLIEAVNQDAELQRRGKYYSVSFGLLTDSQQDSQQGVQEKGDPAENRTNFIVENGQLTDVNHDSMEVDFTIQSSASCWRGFREEKPSPGFHDISALLDTKRARIEGNVMPWLSNMLFVKGVIEVWRHL
jgi:hypothetical protein